MMVPKPKKNFTKPKTGKWKLGLEDGLASPDSQEFMTPQQTQASKSSNTAQSHSLKPMKRKPSRVRRRNHRELERNVVNEVKSPSLPQEQVSSVSTGFSSKWQTQVSGYVQQNVSVQQENIQPPAFNPHQVYHPQSYLHPGFQPVQQEYCLAQVHTFQSTQVLSQWNNQGQSSHSLLSTEQQYRNWYFSSGNHAPGLQIQEVQQTVQQTQMYCAGSQ